MAKNNRSDVFAGMACGVGVPPILYGLVSVWPPRDLEKESFAVILKIIFCSGLTVAVAGIIMDLFFAAAEKMRRKT